MSSVVSNLAKQASANIRAEMAARRTTQRELASGAGFASHNYVAMRLRDEKPFTLDDIERVAAWFEVPIASLLGLQPHVRWSRSGAAGRMVIGENDPYVYVAPTPPGWTIRTIAGGRS